MDVDEQFYLNFQICTRKLQATQKIHGSPLIFLGGADDVFLHIEVTNSQGCKRGRKHLMTGTVLSFS